jgi:hypothetical protein
MSPDELIQLMRTCSMAQVRKTLEKWVEKHPEDYDLIVAFYIIASKAKS